MAYIDWASNKKAIISKDSLANVIVVISNHWSFSSASFATQHWVKILQSQTISKNGGYTL